jgi:hypothetical protein
MNPWSCALQLESLEKLSKRSPYLLLTQMLHKCLYLRVACEKALFGMGSSLVSWTQCRESAVKETKRFGLTTFSRPCTVADMNHDFCSMDFFGVAHGVSKGFQGSELFRIFPEARRMLLAWAKEKLERLNSETAREYLLTIVIPYCRTVCNKELKEHGFKALGPTAFMKFVRLKTLDATTAWRWLKQLGSPTPRTRNVTIPTDTNRQRMLDIDSNSSNDISNMNYVPFAGCNYWREKSKHLRN